VTRQGDKEMDTNVTLMRVHESIDALFPKHLEKTQEFLRLPSVSGDEIGLVRTAEWLKEYVEEIGGSVQFEGNPEAPIVFAKFRSHSAKTILTYGMYDVQAASGESWSSPPFSAEIHLVPEIGPSIIARGSCNSKGPLAGLLNTLHAISRIDEVPVNLLLVIEGEEEIGSPTIERFFRENRHKLRADAGFDPFWAEYGTDVYKPTISLGTKGIITVDLICRGGEWGGPTREPVHSSTGAWLASPHWRLIKALCTLVNEKDEIIIDGIDEDIILPTENEEEMLRVLATNFDESNILQIEGAMRFKYDLQGLDLLRKYFYTPTAQVVLSLQTDSDIIQPEERARLTIRLVPEMELDKTVERLRKHLDKRGYSDIQVLLRNGYPWARTSIREAVVQKMIETYRYHGFEPQIRPISASATPFYLFSRILGIPFVSGGLGRAGRSHSNDEYASVEGLKLLEKSLATFLYKFASPH
jgi:acetylornithine deacetylase/succinyl-diaminopimelate desuccinylase-like protein